MIIPSEELCVWGGRKAAREVAERGECSEGTKALFRAVIRTGRKDLAAAWDRGREAEEWGRE